MKKVLVVTNSVNGLYNFRRELMHTLKQEGYEIIIAAPEDDKMDYFTQSGYKYIATPISRRGTNPIKDIQLLLSYFYLINGMKPNVVLTYTIKPNIYSGLICRVLQIPYVSNITGLGTALENKGLLQKLTLFLYRLSLKKANCVFFQNKDNKDFIEKNNIKAKKHRLIPGSGVNLNHFNYIEYPNEGKLEFLFIGRIMNEKGINQYLDTARYIKSKYPNTVFHILGNCEESYLEKINEMQDQGVIVYHGRQSDVRQFHKISHCTVHPTFYPEGMSNVLLESAACGRPVITTNRSGCKEIVVNNVTGFLVKEKSSEDLIEKVERFIALTHDEKKKMGYEGRKKVEREFNREIVINAYIEELNNMQKRQF